MIRHNIFIFIYFVVLFLFRYSRIVFKMHPFREEKRWYIISEWKKGSINILRTVRFLNCHVSTVYRITNYYRCRNYVSFRYSPDRPPALNSTQFKQLDRTIQKNRSATAELLSLTRFNTSEHTIQRYRLSLGYHLQKTPIKIKKTDTDLLHCIIIPTSRNIFLKTNVILVYEVHNSLFGVDEEIRHPRRKFSLDGLMLI